MKKRLRKKLGKRKCLKCGSEGGVREWYRLASGRLVMTKLTCFYCDLGVPR